MSVALFQWVVTEPLTLAELLGERGLGHAIGEGRVFVDAKRASAAPLLLSRGSLVEVFAPRPSASIELLFEAEGVVAVHKPAALPTEPDHAGQACVLQQLAERLALPSQQLFALSRLDVGVSGVLLVATDARARDALLAEREQGRLERRYVALACGVPAPVEGEWREALGNAGRGKRAVDGRQARAAHTRFRVVAGARSVVPEGAATSLLSLSPVTGRTHQLRVHAAAHGAPLLGDRKYGGPPRMTAPDGAVHAFSQILLHAAWVSWGSENRRKRVVAEPVSAFVDAWLALGGDAAAIQRALE
jgi:23S rRNA pseudouridine1911/1915/1917 synthase